MKLKLGVCPNLFATSDSNRCARKQPPNLDHFQTVSENLDSLRSVEYMLADYVVAITGIDGKHTEARTGTLTDMVLRPA